MNKKPKKFFMVPTARQILDHTTCTNIKSQLDELCAAVISSKDETSIRINGDLLLVHPKTYKKQGETLIITPHSSSNGKPLRPFELRREAIADWLDLSMKYLFEDGNPHSVNELVPFSNFAYQKKDGTLTGKIFPLHIAKAAKIYSYAQWSQNKVPRIDVKAYDMLGEKFIDLSDSKARASQNGAQLVVFVPSRTQRNPRYKIKFSSIPVIDDENKHLIAYNLASTHICEDKLYGNIAHPPPKTKYINCLLDYHDIAGTFGIFDYYLNPLDRGSIEPSNNVPLEMNLTGIPTESFARDLDTLLHRTVILHKGEKHEKKLNDAEMNYILSAILIFTGHDLNLFAEPSKESGKKIKDYTWTSLELYKNK